MKTQVNAQSTLVTSLWWENANPDFKRTQKFFFDRIDRYMNEFGSVGAIENISTMLEHYLHVQTEICHGVKRKEIARVVVNATSLMAFMSTFQRDYQDLRKVPFSESKPIEASRATINSEENLNLCINRLCKELEEAKTHQDLVQVNALTTLIARLIEISDEEDLDTNPVHVKECAALIKQFRKDYPAKKPVVKVLTPLEQAIEEVWGWYKEVKSCCNTKDEKIQGMLCCWMGFIGELTEYTAFTNPDDYDWQKQLDDYQDEYQSTL